MQTAPLPAEDGAVMGRSASTIANDADKMPLFEKLRLDPLGKYEKYDRFPWKLVVHVLLVALTTYQAILMVELRSGYQRDMFQVLRTIIQQPDSAVSNTVSIFALSDFQAQILRIQALFGNLDGELIPFVNTQSVQYRFEVYYQEFESARAQRLVFDVRDISDFTEPFNPKSIDSIRALLRQARRINFMADGFQTLVPYSAQHGSETCFAWNLTIAYSVDEGKVRSTLRLLNDYCKSQSFRDFGPNLIFVHALVCVFASVSLYLACKYVYDVTVKYNEHKQQKKLYEKDLESIRQKIGVFTGDQAQVPAGGADKGQYARNIAGSALPESGRAEGGENQDESVSSSDSEQQTRDLLHYRRRWRDLTLLQRLSFFNFYTIFGIVGNIFQILGALVSVLDVFINLQYSIFLYKVPIIGFGCMCAWLVVLNYLKYYDRYNIMTRTMGAASSSLMYFTLGVLPFFFAFAFLCQMVFVRVEQFDGLLATSISLFGMALGDSMNDFFSFTVSQGVLGHIVLILYVLIFYTAVQNIFIALVMEAYDVVQKRRKRRQALVRQYAQYGDGSGGVSTAGAGATAWQFARAGQDTKKHRLQEDFAVVTSNNLQKRHTAVVAQHAAAQRQRTRASSLIARNLVGAGADANKIGALEIVFDKIFQYDEVLKADLESLALLVQDIDTSDLTPQQKREVKRTLYANAASLISTLKYELHN